MVLTVDQPGDSPLDRLTGSDKQALPLDRILTPVADGSTLTICSLVPRPFPCVRTRVK